MASKVPASDLRAKYSSKTPRTGCRSRSLEWQGRHGCRPSSLNWQGRHDRLGGSPVIVIAAISFLGTIGCASRPAGPTESFGRSSDVDLESPAKDAGAASRDAGARLLASDVYFDAGTAGPGRLMAEVDHQQLLLPSTAGQMGASGLVLHVTERGPGEPWIIAVSNEGTEAAHMVADTRLIWLEVTLPGAKKTSRCRLPDELLPKEAEPRLDIELSPGEYVAQLIDPRLYCFASGDQKQLVPGARVVAHLGWPEAPNKTTWERGKQASSPVPQPPPFIAHRSSVDVEQSLSARKAALKVAKAVKYNKGVTRPTEAALGVPLPAGIDKQIAGPELTLRVPYAEWSSKAQSAAQAGASENPLDIRLVQGSDARTEHDATVQFTLRNRSKRKLFLYFRREFVTFEVIGPNGVTICSPAPDDRSPDRHAFVSLAPGAKQTYSTRLAEMCPKDTFDMPGLYLVSARYDATETGTEWNLAAYTGTIATDRPANVRIRTGELSILHKVVLSRPVDPATANAAPSAAPPAARPAPDAGAPRPREKRKLRLR